MRETIVVAVIAAVPGVVAALLGVKNHNKLDTLTVNVDGRLSQLLELTRTASFAEGQKDEKGKPRE